MGTKPADSERANRRRVVVLIALAALDVLCLVWIVAGVHRLVL
jgi:hypothetical protein